MLSRLLHVAAKSCGTPAGVDYSAILSSYSRTGLSDNGERGGILEPATAALVQGFQATSLAKALGVGVSERLATDSDLTWAVRLLKRSIVCWTGPLQTIQYLLTRPDGSCVDDMCSSCKYLLGTIGAASLSFLKI